MKIYICIIISVLLLWGCSSKNDTWEWVIEESWKILNEYIDTLEWSVSDAKAAAELINQKNGNLEDALNRVSK